MNTVIREIKTLPISYIEYDSLTPNPHLHNELEIIYVEEGDAIAYADNNRFKLSTGELFISFPNQVHYYGQKVQGKYHVIIFSADILFGIKDLVISNIPTLPIINVVNNTDTLNLLNRFIKCDCDYNETERVGILNLLMATILRKITLTPCAKADSIALRDILNFCEKNFENELSLEIVSNALHLNKYYISRLLNRNLRHGFNHYVSTLRVNKACYLLTHTDKKISDISEEVGFGSIRSFNRAFLDIIKTTPIIYRNKTD